MEEVRRKRRRKRPRFSIRIGRSRWRQRIKRSRRRKRIELALFMSGLGVVTVAGIAWAVSLAYPHFITLRDVPDTGIPEVVFEPEKAPTEADPTEGIPLPPKDDKKAPTEAPAGPAESTDRP